MEGPIDTPLSDGPGQSEAGDEGEPLQLIHRFISLGFLSRDLSFHFSVRDGLNPVRGTGFELELYRFLACALRLLGFPS